MTARRARLAGPALAALALAVGCAEGSLGEDTEMGPELGADAGDPGDPADAAPAPDAIPAPVERTLTHSSSQSITAENSVSCNVGSPDFFHTENSYYRVFDLSALGVSGSFSATKVTVGIEQAVGAGGSQPITVRLHTLSGAVLQTGALTQLASVEVAVPNQQLTLLEVPITASVPAGSRLVVEILTPDGVAGQNSFFIGSNAAGQSGPSFVRAPADGCALVEPTDIAGLGFPDTHFVLSVTGLSQ